MKPKVRLLSEDRALDLLNRPGHELMLLHCHDEADGHGYYVVPDGGRLRKDTARKIIERPDIQPFSEGLFPPAFSPGGASVPPLHQSEHEPPPRPPTAERSPPFVMMQIATLDAPAWRAMSHGAGMLLSP